jgi:hypothetical protein
MKLTNEQILECAVGSVNTVITEQGIKFNKCTDKQISAFTALNQAFGQRAAATTGIRLDFHTNSSKLSFSASKGTKFDVAVDGLLVAQLNMKEQREAGTHACLELTSPLDKKAGEEVRVTIYFPSHDEPGMIDLIELDDGASFSPHKFDKKFLFIGDSITQGWNTKYDSLSFALLLSELWNAESVVNGVGGAYFHETVFDSVSFDPDVVFVAYGTNDYSHFKTLDELKYHAESFFDKIKDEYLDKGKKVIYISPIVRKDRAVDKPMGSFASLRSLLTDLAKERGFHHIDGLSLVPPVFFDMFADALHPNMPVFLYYTASLLAKTSSIINK